MVLQTVLRNILFIIENDLNGPLIQICSLSLVATKGPLQLNFVPTIVKILNLYIILLCSHLYHFLPVAIHSLQRIHCLLQLYVMRYLIGIIQGLI